MRDLGENNRLRLISMNRSKTTVLIGWFDGGQGRNRTSDTVIFSHVLYQLSYLAPMRISQGVQNLHYNMPD